MNVLNSTDCVVSKALAYNSKCRKDDPSTCSNQEHNGKSGDAKESKKEREKRLKKEAEKKKIEEKVRRQASHIAHGVKSMAKVSGGYDVRDFMPGFANANIRFDHVAFYQGNDGEGFIHIRDHEPYVDEESGIDEGYNHQEMLKGDCIPATIAKGTMYRVPEVIKDKQGKAIGTRTSYVSVLGDKMVVLGEDGAGLKVITAYVSPSKVKKIRVGGYQRVLNCQMLEASHLDEQGFVFTRGPKANTATSCASAHLGFHGIVPKRS